MSGDAARSLDAFAGDAPGQFDVKVDTMKYDVGVFAVGALGVASLLVHARGDDGTKRFLVDASAAVQFVCPEQNNYDDDVHRRGDAPDPGRALRVQVSLLVLLRRPCERPQAARQ